MLSCASQRLLDLRRVAPICLVLALYAAPTAAPAAEIVGTGEARPIYPNMIGYNSDYYYMTNPWASETRRLAAGRARPGMLRYPGGTSANYWDAYHSRLFRDGPAVVAADGNPATWTQTRYTINWIHTAHFWTNVTPLADFKRLLAELAVPGETAADTIFVANMVTPGPDYYTLKWGRGLDHKPGSDDWWAMMSTRYGAFKHMLDDATKNGIAVRYVELGNEYYFGAGLTRKGKPADVEPYVAGGYDTDNSHAFADVGAFPDKSGGKDVLYHYSVVANDWAAKVKKERPGVKVCAVGSFVDKVGYGRRTAEWNREALAALDPAKVDALSLHLYGGPQVGSLTETEAKFGAAIKSWSDYWAAGVERSKLPDKFDLWVTEFNIDDEFGANDKLPPSKGTWGNGLGNLYCVHHWLANEPRVKVVLLHELARVIVADGPDIRAHGRAFGLFAKAATGHTRARPVRLQGAPMIAGSDDTAPGLVGWVFDTPGSATPARYAFVNFTDATQDVTGARLLGLTAGTITQASASLATVTDPGKQTSVLSDEMMRRLVLPPRSITVIEGVSQK